MFVRNSWYIAALPDEVHRQEMLARTLLSEPILLYRDTEGRVVALEDRCVHRHLPLSSGRVKGDTVECGYHGLVFNPTGRCVHIPSQDHIPAGAKIRSYPIIESFGWVWIWMGDPALASPKLLDGFFWTEEPGWRFKGERLAVPGNYLLMVDNLLDLTHLQFVHATTLGADGIASAPIRVEHIGDIIRVSRWVLNKPAPPFFQKAGGFTPTEPVDRWQITEFRAPGFIRLDIGCAPAGTVSPKSEVRPGFSLRHHSNLTPETDRTSHYFWCEGHSFRIDDPSMTDLLYRQVGLAVREDLAVIAKQQDAIDRLPDAFQLDLRQDAGGIQARRIVNAMLATEREESALIPRAQRVFGVTNE